MVRWSSSSVSISILARYSFHDWRAARRTPSKSHPGISASTFRRAPSISTAETPTFTITCSSFSVWNCNSTLAVGSNVDAITGATVSTRGVTTGVNAALAVDAVMG